jgi:hypothetical protein
MADIHEELDALFDDEPEKEGEEQEGGDKEAKDADAGKKTGATKAKAFGASKKPMGKTVARTGSLGKTKPSQPAAEPVGSDTGSHAIRTTKPPAAPAASGGASNLLLILSLVLNIVLIVLVFGVRGTCGKLTQKMEEVSSELEANTNLSRAKISVYDDREGTQQTVLMILPKEVTDFPQGTKVYQLKTEDITRSNSK